jgi:MFS family permease
MDATSEAKTYAKVERRLIPFVFLCYVLAYLDRVNISFAKLQMLQDLSLSDAAYGLGAGIFFFIGYFLFEVPSNILLKRFGARTWIGWIMISWGIVSAGMMFVHQAWSFYLMRFLLGLAEAGFFPGIIFYLTLWYPSRLRSMRTALFVSAIAVSGVLGNPISGLIMHSLSGRMGLAGWQWLFLAEGLPSILVGIVVYRYLDSSIAEAKWLSAEEKRLLTQNIEAEDQHKHEVRLIDAFKNGNVWVLSAIYCTLMVGLYGISFWLPTIVRAFGFRNEEYLSVGLITAIPYAVTVVGMILLSRHSDRTGERRMHYVLNVTAGGFGLILSGIFANYPALAIVFLSVGTLGVIGSMPLFWPIPSLFLAGTAAAAGIGIVNSFGNLGGGCLGPNVPVWMKSLSTDPSAALYVIAGALFLSALIALRFLPKDFASTVVAASPRRSHGIGEELAGTGD